MGERVTFGGNGGTANGYLAAPPAPAPGVVVIQEWWGLVPHIEHVTDRLAAAGFVALAPDLFHGATTTSPDEAAKMMMAMRIGDAERELAAAIDYLAARPETTGDKVGTIGFCMGGALSLFAACRNPEVGACVVFYGGHPNVTPDLAALTAPVLGIYAGRDTFVSPAVVAALDTELTRLGKRHEFHTYPDSQHAFFNDDRPTVYDPAAAKDAWAKTLAFFGRELGA
jgi:carboxymethylenebutenolidase